MPVHRKIHHHVNAMVVQNAQSVSGYVWSLETMEIICKREMSEIRQD
jgi:hypothetical protein